MPNSNKTYTYRGGEKVELEKSPNQMVVRALPTNLNDAAISAAEQVSAASTRLDVSNTELEMAMQRSRLFAPTHHAYYESQTGAEFLITDRIFVTFKDRLSDSEIDAFAGRYALIKKTRYGDRDYLFQLTNHTGINPVKLVVQLMEKEPVVELAEHDLNQRVTRYQLSLPADPEYARQWHLHTDLNHEEFDQRASTRCETAWQLLNSFGSEEVVVAVTDDGCKLDHHDFNSANKFASWGYMRGERLITAVDIDADPNQMYSPGANHGTSCCGVIGAESDALLTVGAAPGCRLLPIQWQSSGPALFISDSKLLTVLNYLADKADVVSNSWGSSPSSVWAQPVVTRIRALAESGGRRGKGIVFLWAAGNENCPLNLSAKQDVPFDHGVEVRGGALVWIGVSTARQFRHNLVGLPNVMHVAALASTAQRSHYSNYGPGIDVCAPSNNQHTYYRMTVPGLGITTATGEASAITHVFGGTSSATPLVAGIIALTLSANPALSALEVISLIRQTAAKDVNFTPYGRTPAASFDADTRWDVSPVAPYDQGEFIDIGARDGSWSAWFGHGRVDAADAVAAALDRAAGAAGAHHFEKASASNAAIPDNRSGGVIDTIQCDKNTQISDIKVRLDISHSYIGDLRVTLIAPSGVAVVLHNRSGGNTDNLQRLYSVQNTPNLRSLVGQATAGEWQLQVEDLAAADVGHLRNWSLQLLGQQGASQDLFDQPGILIPDDTAGGVSRILTSSAMGRVSNIEVALDITHTYIGDLKVDLFAPNGAQVTLHNRMGGAADNIIKRYTSINTAGLQALLGSEGSGDWTLKVADHAHQDIGKLNHWGLKLTLTN